MRFRLLLLFALVAGLMVFNTIPSYAQTTITVTSLADGEFPDLVDGQCQLREALQAIGDVGSGTDTDQDGNVNTVDGCNAAGGSPYIINFSVSGTLVMSGAQFAGTMPEIPMNFDVTIDGGNTVSIDPPSGDDAFNMDSNRTMTFTNLTFVGDNNPATNDGQAITNDGGNLIINNVTFTGLSHDWGAAIRNSGTLNITASNFINNAATSTANGNGGAITTNFDMTISGTNFTGNTAVNNGGAIYITGGDTSITGSNFTSNIAQSGDDNEGGGAIFIQTGDLSVLGTAFVSNQATNGSGGAIYINSASDNPVSITGATFDGNIAGGTDQSSIFTVEGGGAIYVIDDVNVQNSAFVGNSARNGGGAMFRAGSYTAVVNNSTFALNVASNHGGGVYFAQTSSNYDVTLSNVTVANNVAVNGGGVYHEGAFGTARLFQTLVADNTSDCVGQMSEPGTGGFNLIQNASGCTGLGSSNLLDVGADLAPFAAQFYPLMPSSPAYDGGDPNNCSIIIDQVGAPRPQDGDSDGTAVCDIGAIEMPFGTGGNDAPVAVDDTYTIMVNTQLDESAPGILGNDSDPNGDSITVGMIVSGVSNGSLSINNDGSFTYTPDTDFTGTDSFTYQASDGALLSNVATVTITVDAPGNDAPVAVDDDYTTDAGVTLNVLPADGVLDNDTDADGDTLTAVLDDDVDNGTLAFNADGSFSYTPNAGFDGTDSFTYYANDGTTNSLNPATVTITVNPVNTPPVAVDDDYSTDAGVTLNVLPADGVLDNDTDVDGDTLTAVLDDDVDNGTLLFDPNGAFSYIPDIGFFGTDSFTYFANDGTSNSLVAATVTITVNAPNNAPIAVDDEYSTNEDTPLNVTAPGVLDNDVDPDGDPITVDALVTDASNGSVTLNPDGSFTYTPDPNFNGLDSFTYTATDGTDTSFAATVEITVAPLNDAPVAVDDAYMTDEGVTLNVPANGVLGNDSDVDGDMLMAALDTDVATGSLTFNADGSFEYIPAGGPGVVTFTYVANDGAANSNIATVTITINSAGNDAPVAVDDAYTTDEGVTLNVLPADGVLDNDTDADGDTLTAVLNMGPSNGTLTLNPDGSFSYTPNGGFFGTDSFTYYANDGTDNSNIATVTITVNQVGGGNNAPVAMDDAYMTDEGVTLNVLPADGVLDNDTDADGDTLTAALNMGPSNGTLTLNPDGSFSYTPNGGFFGADSFTYYANDGIDNSNIATVTITVNQVGGGNNAPVAVDDAYMTDEGVTLNVLPADGVLDNDTDADGDTLTAALNMGPSNGTLTLNPDGSFSYTPNGGFFGTDSFTYRANDGTDNSNIATVTITVNQVGGGNTAPVANNDSYSVEQNTVLNVAAPGVLDNDTDADGDMLTAVLGTGASNGTVTLNADGSFTYTPNAGYTGADSFTYMANDGTADSGLALVSINVLAPGATPDPSVTPAPAMYPTPDPVPLLALLGNEVNPVVRALVPDNVVRNGNVFGRVLVENGVYIESSGTIGVLDLLNRGVWQAVDVFALSDFGSITRFDVPVTVCLLGTGDLFYLDATLAPRVPQLMPTFMSGGYTCTEIPNAGTLVLVR